MKVLLVNKFFFLKGGSETVFFQERDFLLRNGIKVIDFSMEDHRNFPSSYSEYFVRNISYNANLAGSKPTGLTSNLRAALDFVHSREAVRRLTALVEMEKPDIAHLHNIYHQLTPSIIPFLKKHGVKIILTLHDSKLICPNHTMLRDDVICEKCEGRHFFQATVNKCQDNSIMESLLLSLEGYWHKWTRTYDKVDLFLAPSQFIANLITKYRIEPQRVQVLHNGVDVLEYICPNDDGSYALFFGRLSMEKGVDTLLKAYELSSNRLPLKIVGTGPLLNGLREKYPQIEFSGYKTGDELRQIIQAAAFVIVPSECYENCSMTVLESMAYGKPVIGSRIGGIPEQIENNKTGLLFEMGNTEELAQKMDFLSKEEESRKKMGIEARKKIKREYSLQIHRDKLIRIYNELLSGG